MFWSRRNRCSFISVQYLNAIIQSGCVHKVGQPSEVIDRFREFHLTFTSIEVGEWFLLWWTSAFVVLINACTKRSHLGTSGCESFRRFSIATVEVELILGNKMSPWYFAHALLKELCGVWIILQVIYKDHWEHTFSHYIAGLTERLYRTLYSFWYCTSCTKTTRTFSNISHHTASRTQRLLRTCIPPLHCRSYTRII